MPFSQQTLDFLVENKLADSREWFRERRKDYEAHVAGPMKELVNSMTGAMLAIDPGFVSIISRLNRDTRFSHDKSLYRENVWVVFCRDKNSPNLPGFYLDVSPAGFEYGCGFYEASAAYMNAFRALILDNDAYAARMLDEYRGQSVFRVEGPRYARPRYPDHPPEKREFLELRSVNFAHKSKDFDLLFSPELGDVIARDFLHLREAYACMIWAGAKMIQ